MRISRLWSSPSSSCRVDRRACRLTGPGLAGGLAGRPELAQRHLACVGAAGPERVERQHERPQLGGARRGEPARLAVLLRIQPGCVLQQQQEFGAVRGKGEAAGPGGRQLLASVRLALVDEEAAEPAARLVRFVGGDDEAGGEAGDFACGNGGVPAAIDRLLERRPVGVAGPGLRVIVEAKAQQRRERAGGGERQADPPQGDAGALHGVELVAGAEAGDHDGDADEQGGGQSEA